MLYNHFDLYDKGVKSLFLKETLALPLLSGGGKIKTFYYKASVLLIFCQLENYLLTVGKR